jgi:predicted DsbA family dithiol-disulfide isomerase
LGASPTSNSDTVIEHWRKQGVEVDIEWRNPLLLWEMDEYGDDFDEYMAEEYGDDWEDYWKREWENRKDKKNYGYND